MSFTKDLDTGLWLPEGTALERALSLEQANQRKPMPLAECARYRLREHACGCEVLETQFAFVTINVCREHQVRNMSFVNTKLPEDRGQLPSKLVDSIREVAQEFKLSS